MPAISSSAPGKVILCGEHAVVYGIPAIALPVFKVSTTAKVFAHPLFEPGNVHINAPAIALDDSLTSLEQGHPLKIAIDLVMRELGVDHIPSCEIRISTTLPVSAGLGSSASVTVALVRAVSTYLGHPLADEIVNQIAYEIEKLHHGSPSGIDNTVITYGTPVFFELGKTIEYLKIASPFTLIIADTGIKSSTGAAVAGMRERWNADPTLYNTIFNEIGSLTLKIRKYLEEGSIEDMGKTMTENHKLLQRIGVSNDELDILVKSALASGAWGAKLSGGGLGGNMIALVHPEISLEVSQALLRAGAKNTITTVIPSSSGVRL